MYGKKIFFMTNLEFKITIDTTTKDFMDIQRNYCLVKMMKGKKYGGFEPT
jgi:hypothetical protein